MFRRSAFTVIELLVAIGVIAVLAALVLPVVNRIRVASQRTSELSDLRQLTAACITYCHRNDDLFPSGRTVSMPPGADDYTWINFRDCWSQLATFTPNLNQINSCRSVRDGYSDADDFGVNGGGGEYGWPNDTKVGWIYWGGRDDLIVDGKLQYRSSRRLGQQMTPGSHTLWTCWCWDSAGRGGPSICPHVGAGFAMYPNGVPLKPPPDGLGVALDDGSASFVRWSDLIIIPQANGWKLYYQP